MRLCVAVCGCLTLGGKGHLEMAFARFGFTIVGFRHPQPGWNGLPVLDIQLGYSPGAAVAYLRLHLCQIDWPR
jgi:hypothetical protein